MGIILKKAYLGWGLGGAAISLWMLGPSGCSDSSAAPPGGDASTADASVEAGPAPPLGVPVMSCVGCPVCAGVLTSATTGIAYCTQDCTATTDCPSGTACVANNTSSVLLNQCIKTCSGNADCTAPFICRSDLVSPGSYCWSPFPPVGAGTSDAGDAAAADSGSPEAAAPPVDAGSPPADSGATDGAASDAGDGS